MNHRYFCKNWILCFKVFIRSRVRRHPETGAFQSPWDCMRVIPQWLRECTRVCKGWRTPHDIRHQVTWWLVRRSSYHRTSALRLVFVSHCSFPSFANRIFNCTEVIYGCVKIGIDHFFDRSLKTNDVRAIIAHSGGRSDDFGSNDVSASGLAQNRMSTSTLLFSTALSDILLIAEKLKRPILLKQTMSAVKRYVSNRHKRVISTTMLPVEMGHVVLGYVPYPQTKGQRKRVAKRSHQKLLQEMWMCYGVQLYTWIMDLVILSPSVCDNIRSEYKNGGECYTWRLRVRSNNENETRVFGYQEGAMSDLLLRVGADDDDVQLQHPPATRAQYKTLLYNVFGRLSLVRYCHPTLQPV